MQYFRFEGQAISCNRRLAPGLGRLRGDEEYKAFRKAMAWTFRAQKKQATIVRPDVLISTTIGPQVDAHNLGKPILDALQDAGVIENDRQVNWLTFAPPDRHKRGEPDIIIVHVWEKEEKTEIPIHMLPRGKE